MKEKNNYLKIASNGCHNAFNQVAIMTNYLQLMAMNTPEIKDNKYYRRLVKINNENASMLESVKKYRRTLTMDGYLAFPLSDSLDLLTEEYIDNERIIFDFSAINAADTYLYGKSVDFSYMLIELINNVLEIEDANAHLTIYTENDNLCIILTDSGPGFPNEVLEGSLNPFVTGKAGHAGIGLFIVDNVVTNMNGSVSYSNYCNNDTHQSCKECTSKKICNNAFSLGGCVTITIPVISK